MVAKFYALVMMSLLTLCKQKDLNPPSSEAAAVDFEWVVQETNIPWGMADLPDGSLLYTEKEGIFYHVSDGKKREVGRPEEIYLRGQGGLLDICLHPDFKNNKKLYFTMSRQPNGEKGGNTALFSAEFDGKTIQNTKLLYQATPLTTAGHHFGSRIVFDKKGYLYFTIGDRGDRDLNPQDVNRDGGKVYRLKDDGSVPADNPFKGNDGKPNAVFSYGHRNLQGMFVHPETDEVWTNEHGPKGGDEINIIKKGANYGWPVITYGKEYSGLTITEETSRPGMEQPLYYWIPSIAPSGMCFVDANVYPDWKGNVLVGSLVFEYLERLELKNNKVVARHKLFEDMGRVRNVITAPDGMIYVAIENKGILKIKPQKK